VVLWQFCRGAWEARWGTWWRCVAVVLVAVLGVVWGCVGGMVGLFGGAVWRRFGAHDGGVLEMQIGGAWWSLSWRHFGGLVEAFWGT